MKFKSDIEVQAGLKDSSGAAGTSGQVLSTTVTGVSWVNPDGFGYVPYTGATANVDLGSHKLTASDLVINHASGSGVAASITKGGSGEALTVIKSSGSGNAASITGGTTLISELHLTTDLADDYIASAATWNAKQSALSGTGFVKISGTTISYDNSTYALDSAVVKLTGDQTISGVKTFSNPTTFNSSLNIASGAYSILYNPANSAYWQTYVDSSNVFNFGYNGNVVKASINNSGNLTANSFIKSGGTSLQFLKADGSVDSTTYQTALTNPVTGTGTTNYIPKFTGSTALGNSLIYDNGTNVGIRTTSPTHLLSVENSSSYETASFKSSSVPYQIIGNAAVGDYWRGFFTGQNIVTNATTGKPSIRTSGFTASAIAYSADSSQGYLGFFTTSSTTANTDLSERMRITSVGNVGIGTTSPSAKLQVEGNSIINGVSGDDTLYLQKPTGATLAISGATGTTNKILIGGSNATNPDMFVYVGGSERMRITSGGNVGIGTTSPTYKLQVNGTAAAASNAEVLRLYNTLDGGLKINFANAVTNELAYITANVESAGAGTDDGVLTFGTAVNGTASERMRITSGGNVGIGTATPYSATNYKFLTIDGTNGSGYVSRVNSVNSFLFYSNASGSTLSEQRALPLLFETNGSEKMRLTTNGELLIGRTSSYGAGWQLAVEGNIYAKNDLRIDANASFGGNVGIGTTSPNQLLSISSSAVGGSTFGLYNTASNTDNRNWALKLNANNYGDLGFFVSSSNGGNPESGSIPMLINKSGNVGIGTTSPINGGGAAKWLTIDGTTNYSGGLVASINGNAKAYFYSQDNYAIVQGASGQGVKLMPNGAEGVTVLSGGNVGIGTTSPSAKLHVVGSAFFSSYVDLTGFVTTGNNFMSSSGGIFFKGYNNFETGILTANSGNDFLIQTGSSERMRITSGGNVGIGTSSPAAKLTVVEGVTYGVFGPNKSTISAVNTTTDGKAGFIDVVGYSGNTVSPYRWGGISGGKTSGVGDGNYGGFLSLWTTSGGGNGEADSASYERMRITSGGNLLIGTTTDAGYKLDVNGTGRFLDNLTVNKEGGIIGIDASNNPRIGFVKKSGEQPFLAFASAPFLLKVSSGSEIFASNTFTTVLSIATSGAATISSLAGTGTRLVTANASGVLSTTAGDAAPRYSSYVIVSHSSYTNICTINGDALASAIKMSFQGTSDGTVVNTTAEILVNHYQDISVTSNSGIYSQLNIRIISNNNESYSIEAQVIGATTPTGLNIEVFPLNSEAVTFQGTLVTAGTTLVHTTRPGIYISATGGDAGTISAGGSIYAGETMVSNGNATFGNTANRRVNYDSNGGNFRIKANSGGWAMGYFFDGSSGTYRGGFGGFGGADTLTYYWIGSDYNIPTMIVQPNQGNVLIGTTTDAGYKLDVAGTGRVTGSLTINSATTPFLHFHSTRTSGQSGYIKDDGNMVFQKTESGGGFRFLNSSSSVLLSIDAVGASAFSNNVTITPPSNQVALRVNHSGTNGAEGSKFNSAGSGTTYGSMTMLVDSCNYGTGIRIVTGLWSASQSAMQFYSGTTSVGSISCTTSATAYNTSSDYRLKENVVPMESPINRLKELNPCRFNFINNPDKTVDGFIAHEVQGVIPEAITGEKDELDYDGSPKYQGIDQSKIVPLLTAALQEAISKIEELENRLLILENK